jgi:hypothetical protein
MTLQVSQAVIPAGTTPSALTPAASDTIAAGSFGPNGLYARVITTGTATTVSVQDPNITVQGNPATVTGVVCPSTGVRMIFIPVYAINQSTGVATVLFSGALTGVTYELYRA